MMAQPCISPVYGSICREKFPPQVVVPSDQWFLAMSKSSVLRTEAFVVYASFCQAVWNQMTDVQLSADGGRTLPCGQIYGAELG